VSFHFKIKEKFTPDSVRLRSNFILSFIAASKPSFPKSAIPISHCSMLDKASKPKQEEGDAQEEQSITEMGVRK
jgi:hypothetical protein